MNPSHQAARLAPVPTLAVGPDSTLPDEDELVELLARALVADLKARPNSVRVKATSPVTVGPPSGPDREPGPGKASHSEAGRRSR